MSEPTFSPDGKWMWNGTEWVPNPEIASQSSSNNQKVSLNDSVISGDVINTVNNSPEAIASGVLAALKEIGITRGLQASDEQLERFHQIEELIETNENLSPEVYYSMADKEFELAMNCFDDFQGMRNLLSKAKKFLNQSLKSALINNDKSWEALASSTIDFVEFYEILYSGNSYLDIDKDKVLLFGERVIEKISEKSIILETTNDMKKLIEIHTMKAALYQLFGNLLRWSDYSNAKTFFDLGINEYQKVVNYSNSTSKWEDAVDSYSELVDLFTITKNYPMAEISFKNASEIIQKHNLGDIYKFNLFMSQLSFVKATKIGMELENESKSIRDIIYATGFNSGIKVSVIDKLIEYNDDSDVNLPPPPVPALLNKLNSNISTSIQNQNHSIVSSNTQESEHRFEMIFLGIIFLAVGVIDVIGSHNGFDLWGDFLGFDLPLWLWMITGYIEISLGFLFISAASGD